jgi:hypothetical protein
MRGANTYLASIGTTIFTVIAIHNEAAQLQIHPKPQPATV